jgi:predicted dehydrogenase
MTRTPIRWGILSTAHIAETAFLPALRAGGGEAHVVGGRDHARTNDYARRNNVGRAVANYQSVLDDPEVEAVYIPLPNSLHAEWTVKALNAGKAVLCEKPLCGSVSQTRIVLAAAEETQRPLWEAFVFPFHKQHARLVELIGDGTIGIVREIQSEFHFRIRDRANIRLSPTLAGGALHDVGCYPVRFAQLMFASSPKSAICMAKYAPEGVDEEAQGVLEYESGQRLLMSCGMARDSGTFSRIIGDLGEIRITNPFHARQDDTIEVRAGGVTVERLGTSEPTFAEAIRHIHAVLNSVEAPRFTALDDSLATEVGLDLLSRSARSGELEQAT